MLPAEILAKMQPFVDILAKETHRGCALTASSWLELTLKNLIESKFVNEDIKKDSIFSAHAPLSTFSGNIKVAYCFGFIDEIEYRTLDVVRKIRNKFAHSHDLDLSFDSDVISSRCDHLLNGHQLESALRKSMGNNKGLYGATCAILMVLMSQRALSAKKTVV